MSLLSKTLRPALTRPTFQRTRTVVTKASNVEGFVNDSIKANKVVVFSKTYCPYCTKAKRALDTLIPGKYSIIELDGNPDMDAIQDTLLGITGGRSVPRVFVGGKFIGGGDDTARMASNGELKSLLSSVGAL